MRFVIVMETDDREASAAIERLLERAPNDFDGFAHAFTEMSWNEPASGRALPPKHGGGDVREIRGAALAPLPDNDEIGIPRAAFGRALNKR